MVFIFSLLHPPITTTRVAKMNSKEMGSPARRLFKLASVFFRFLLDHGASVSAVNNDGELAIDISESDEMEELLQKEIDKQGVNCDKSRHTEERMMLEDARTWLNSKRFGDVAHAKTGATALHVAAAKGYNKVSHLTVITQHHSLSVDKFHIPHSFRKDVTVLFLSRSSPLVNSHSVDDAF